MDTKRLIKDIYVIKCKCGEIVYVYENRILYTEDDIYCNQCGNVFARDVIMRKGQLMYFVNWKYFGKELRRYV